MTRRLTTKEFIVKVKLIKGNKYDYSKVNYINSCTKVEIICPQHGSFWQIPVNHYKYGCTKCGYEKVSRDLCGNIKDSIFKAKLIHGSKYIYSKVKYTYTHTPVEIICPIHGSFWQAFSNHNLGQGCPKCGYERIRKSKQNTLKDFIIKARLIFGDLYDYSEFVYIGSHIKGKIICSKHGGFLQRPNDHLFSYGCPKCGQEKIGDLKRLNNKEYINRAIFVHGNKYDYSEVDYVRGCDKIKIICKKHGSFWQQGQSHINESRGCPKCSHHISSQEIKLYNALKKKLPNTEIIQSDRTVLRPKELDIYIPKYKLAIEVNGAYWHKEEYGNGPSYFKLKTRECKKQGIILLHFWDYEINNNFENVILKIKTSFLALQKVDQQRLILV